MFCIKNSLLTVLLFSGLTSLAYGQCGEASHNFRCNPRILPGAPGVYEVISGVANATPDSPAACGLDVGHTVWFKVIPTEDSLLTFTTCHPATSYDTVLQVWGGSCEIPVRLDDLCSDDVSGDPSGAKGWGLWGAGVGLGVGGGVGWGSGSGEVLGLAEESASLKVSAVRC